MNKFYLICLAFLLFLLGWLFPIEGPLDYIYDYWKQEQTSSTSEVKKPHKGVPASAPKKTEIYEDFNEDGEPEWYQLIPMFEVEE